MKILLVQNTVLKDKNNVYDNIDSLINAETDIIVLPEMFSTPYELKYFDMYKEDKDGETIKWLSNLAKKHNSYVVGGSIPYYEDCNIYNSCFIFDREGNIINRYDKIHLFEITYPNGKHFSEADVLIKGNEIVTFETEFGTMGVMICFDIRFPELATKLMEKGSKVIFVPAAFNTYTGPMHWRTTFQSRAIDNQLYMVGCSPSNDSYGNYDIYGHSIVVDPYGTILEELDEKEGTIFIDIDLDKIEEARNRIPIIKNRVL